MASNIRSQLASMQTFTNQMQYEKGKETMGSSTLGKDAFLRLLTEQLKNQDPLKPMDNMQFLQQSATFTQIEELQNLTKSITSNNTIQQASSMVGKTVSVINPDNPDQVITGPVSAAHFSEGNSAIEIDGTLYPLDIIVKVE